MEAHGGYELGTVEQRLERVESELSSLQGLVGAVDAGRLERARWSVLGVLTSGCIGRLEEAVDEGCDEPGRVDVQGGRETA